MKTLFRFLPIFLAQTAFSQFDLLTPEFQNKVDLHYENDLFARTDRYYSQGIFLNYANKSGQQGEFANRNVEVYYNWNLSHKVFTPSTIMADSALQNDRPYAAAFSVSVDRILKDVDEKFLLSMGIELGGVGPFAFGKQMQTGIHRATNNFLPLGWQHQIANGLILNYHSKFDFNLVQLKEFLTLNTGLDLELGSFRNNLKPNFTLALGELSEKRFVFYSTSSLSFIGYDGTLQGSLIGEKSNVTIDKNELERMVFLQEFGLRFGFERLRFGINYATQSKTFSQQLSNFHSWGGVEFTYLIP